MLLHFLAIVNTAPMNLNMQLSILQGIQEMELAGSYSHFGELFKKTSN